MEFWGWTSLFMFICLMNNSAQGMIRSRELSDITTKTIQSEDGDVIHCIDIYRQPAFNHPLLENHTIEMVPSFYSEETNRSLEEKIFQTWQKNGSCPEGTIPVLNIRNKQENFTFMSLNVLPGEMGGSTSRLELAGYVSPPGTYAGIKGRFLVCSHVLVEPNDFTVAAVMVEAATSSLQLGWMANQIRGSINLAFPGFIHTSTRVALGASLIQDNNNNNLVEFTIRKDNSGRNWWAYLDTEPIGYWPDSLFNDLHTAQNVGWSGIVSNSRPGGHHTRTQMGNGVHPELAVSSNDGPAPAFVDDMGVLSSSSADFYFPTGAILVASYPRCYSAVLMERGRSRSNIGRTMYYGGTGRRGCDANL